MEWNTFLEEYKKKECFDLQVEFLKLNYRNVGLVEYIKQDFYKFWESTKFETTLDYYNFISVITICPTMYKILEKYLYLILMDTKSLDLDIIVKILLEKGVKIEEDQRLDDFLIQYMKEKNVFLNYRLLSQLRLKNDKYVRLLIKQQVDELIYSGYPNNIYNQMIDLLIEDLKKIARESDVDDTVYYLDRGMYSEVYKIGRYVLKIGGGRGFQIDRKMNSPYLVRRIFYKEFQVDGLCIEIMPFTDTKHITKEDVQEIYNRNREDGYFWYDPKKDNLGKLLFDSEEPRKLFPSLTPLGEKFLGCSPHRVQKCGDKVIIDLDYYFDLRNMSSEEREKRIRNYLSNFFVAYDYETNYQQQKIKQR